MTATIRVKTTNLVKHMTGASKTNTSLAGEMGMSHTTVGRIIRGIHPPGERFIAGVLGAFPYLEFDDLFEVVTEGEVA